MKTQQGKKIALTFQDKCCIQINEFLRVQTCVFRLLAFLASHFIDSQSEANAVTHWATAWIIQCCSVSAPVVRCMGKNQWREKTRSGAGLVFYACSQACVLCKAAGDAQNPPHDISWRFIILCSTSRDALSNAKWSLFYFNGQIL